MIKYIKVLKLRLNCYKKYYCREKWIASDAQRKEEMQLAQLMQQEKEKAEKVEAARKIVLETLVSKQASV